MPSQPLQLYQGEHFQRLKALYSLIKEKQAMDKCSHAKQWFKKYINKHIHTKLRTKHSKAKHNSSCHFDLALQACVSILCQW